MMREWSSDQSTSQWLGYHKLRNELKKETAEHTADLKKLAASSAQEKSLRVELARERTKYSKLEASWKAKYDGLYENYCYALSESHKQEDEMKELRQKLNELRQKLMPKPSRCCDCQYEPDRNFDFRGISDAGKSFVRGGAPYIRPVGSMRHALAVYERYDDKQWLNEDDSGWPVAYHGTSRESAAAIIRNGFHLSKGKRFQFGRGIYCTPDPATAKEYSTVCNDGNKRWKCVLQVRVKPGGYRVAKRTDSNDGEYWLVTDSAHIRPYAVCVYAV